MSKRIDEHLRRCILNSDSISAVAREAGVPQATLQEFAIGKANGQYSDLRLTSAQKLIDYFGLSDSFVPQSAVNGRSRRMLLAEELQACECADSPEKFKERLIESLIDLYPGQTIDGLVCTPLDAVVYCARIREGVGSEALADVVILKALMNIRKRKDCPVGLKPVRTPKLLKKELASVHCEIDAEGFRELVVDCIADMYKNRTIDELVCHPREARMLCNYVRNRANCSTLPDRLILNTLMNVRKAA